MNLLLDTHVLLWGFDDPTPLFEYTLTIVKKRNNALKFYERKA